MRTIIFSLCAACLLFAGGLWGQSGSQTAQEPTTQNPQTQSPAQTQSQPQSQSEQQPADTNTQPKKLKKLSGKLVDAPCMVKGLSSMQGGGANSPGNTAEPAPGATQAPKGNSFAGSGDPGQVAGQAQPGAQGQSPAGQAQPPGAQGPSTPAQYPSAGQQGPAISGPTPAERAAEQCPATASTTAFGLITDGKFVKLDDQGNSKATEAIKSATLKEGKAPKAKIKGTLEGDTVRVAEIQVKGQRSSGSQNRQGQGQGSPGK